MTAIKLNLGHPIRPLVIDSGGGVLNFAGTAFELEKRGLFVTSSHVLGDVDDPHRVRVFLDHDNCPRASVFHKHPQADVTVLMVEHTMELSPLKLDRGPADITSEHNFGEEVVSYGYPSRPLNSDLVELEPRLMRGNVQRKFKYQGYSAYEMSFPVLDGQSGSPVILSSPPNVVVGVITTNFESHVPLPDSYRKEMTEGGKEVVYIENKVLTHGICAELWPISEWLLGFIG